MVGLFDRAFKGSDEMYALAEKALAEARYQLGKNGRVLLRKSGTEPVVRVMSEAALLESAKEAVETVTEAIKASGHAVQEA